MTQRLLAAIVMRETDPPYSPLRRLAGATLAGVLVAVLALAATAAYGLRAPGGGTAWRDAGAVVVERETGARFVYRDGRLHPVANYASALLILGSVKPATMLVPRASIAGVPRGVRLGIPDAPDSLPVAGGLLGPPWTVCSRRAESVLFVGPQDVRGGWPLAGSGLLARGPDGSVHLLLAGRRHLVRQPGVVLPALGWGVRPVTPVAAALLRALPAGADLARIPVVGRGRRSARVPAARIGEVFVVSTQDGGRQYAVALRDGLAGITQVQADLLIGDPLTGQAVPTVLGQGEYAALPKLGRLVPPVPAGDLPASSPPLVRPDGALCAVVRDADGGVDLLVDPAPPDQAAALPTGSRTSVGGGLADRVLVPPGRGALVATAGTLSLVTDLGVRHELAGPEVLAMLGFTGVHPVALPAGVVTLVPAGPALDPAKASAPLTG